MRRALLRPLAAAFLLSWSTQTVLSAEEESTCSGCATAETSDCAGCPAAEASDCAGCDAGDQASDLTAAEFELFDDQAERTALDLAGIRRMLSPNAENDAAFTQAIRRLAAADAKPVETIHSSGNAHPWRRAAVVAASTFPAETVASPTDHATPNYYAAPLATTPAADPVANQVALFRRTSHSLEELAYDLECVGAYGRSDALRAEAAALRNEARSLASGAGDHQTVAVRPIIGVSSSSTVDCDCTSDADACCGHVTITTQANSAATAAECGGCEATTFAGGDVASAANVEFLCTADLVGCSACETICDAMETLETAATLFNLDVEVELGRDLEYIARGAEEGEETSTFWSLVPLLR